MSKKDFQLIAETIKGAGLDPSTRYRIALAFAFAFAFAFALATVNERFNRSKFLEACGASNGG